MFLHALLGYGFMEMGTMDDLHHENLTYHRNFGCPCFCISRSRGIGIWCLWKEGCPFSFVHQEVSQWHLHIHMKVDSYGNRQNQKQYHVVQTRKCKTEDQELEAESACMASAATQINCWCWYCAVSLSDRKHFHQVRQSSCFVQHVFVTPFNSLLYILPWQGVSRHAYSWSLGKTSSVV